MSIRYKKYSSPIFRYTYQAKRSRQFDAARVIFKISKTARVDKRFMKLVIFIIIYRIHIRIRIHIHMHIRTHIHIHETGSSYLDCSLSMSFAVANWKIVLMIIIVVYPLLNFVNNLLTLVNHYTSVNRVESIHT